MASNYDNFEKLTLDNLEEVAGGIKWGEMDASERVVLADKIGLEDSFIVVLMNSDKLSDEDKTALRDIGKLRTADTIQTRFL